MSKKNEIDTIKDFLRRAIVSLKNETEAYSGFLSLLENAGEVSPKTAKMLLDLAKRDNRFAGRLSLAPPDEEKE